MFFALPPVYASFAHAVMNLTVIHPHLRLAVFVDLSQAPVMKPHNPTPTMARSCGDSHITAVPKKRDGINRTEDGQVKIKNNLTVNCSDALPDIVPEGLGKMLLLKHRASTPKAGKNRDFSLLGSWSNTSGRIGMAALGIAARKLSSMEMFGECKISGNNSFSHVVFDTSSKLTADGAVEVQLSEECRIDNFT